jgi:hypothetical protein
VVGNGVKKPRGFTTYASGTFAAGGSGKIEQIAAAAQGVIGWDDLINVLTALKEFYLGGANWLMQRATVGKVMLLKDGEGQVIVVRSVLCQRNEIPAKRAGHKPDLGRGPGRRDIDPQCDQRGSDRGQGDLDHHGRHRLGEGRHQ